MFTAPIPVSGLPAVAPWGAPAAAIDVSVVVIVLLAVLGIAAGAVASAALQRWSRARLATARPRVRPPAVAVDGGAQ